MAPPGISYVGSGRSFLLPRSAPTAGSVGRPVHSGPMAIGTGIRDRVSFREDLGRAARNGLAEISLRRWRILQVALSAGVAWLVATEVFGHDQAFFAPISAVIVLGLTVRQRGRRAFELALGVAIGIGIADLIVLGTGNRCQKSARQHVGQRPPAR